MKKVSLSVLLIATILLFQNCKKDDAVTGTEPTVTYKLTASINGTAWTPDTLNATITYNAAAKTKIFAFSGTKAQKQVNVAVTVNNSTSTNDFPVATYTVDATGNPLMVYSTQQKNSSGAYVFVPHGSVDQNAGTISISSIDAANKLITGTFNFSSRTINYDGSGNIISVDVANVSSGSFTNLPYTFTSN